MSYNSIAWLPLAVGLTVLGLVLSYLAFRRNGVRSGVRGAAISLLPVAAYLTGAIEMLWKIGAAIGDFGTGFVFSPMKWAGIGVTGLAIALFLAAGGRQRRKVAREARKAARGGQKTAAAQGGTASASLGAPGKAGTALTRALDATRAPESAARTAKGKAGETPAKGARKQAAPPDDMKEIEEILRKHGI